MIRGNRQHRDIQCADDVRLMAKMRRFDQEFTAYGTVEWSHDQGVRYLATLNLGKLYSFIQTKKVNGSYFTPVISFSKRTPMPSGMEEILQLAAKHSLLSKMKNVYESVNYFEHMISVFQIQANNSAYDILEQYRKEIDGYFKERDLQIFCGMVRYAYEAKIISLNSLRRFLTWHGDACREIENMPVAGDKFKRTFYGFILYEDRLTAEGQAVYDAEKTDVLSKYYKCIIKGKIVGPVMQRTFYFHQFNQLREIREEFEEWLTTDKDRILNLVNSMQQLPGVVEDSAFEAALQDCSDSRGAVDAINYYRNIINSK